jgi:RND family efflux transporter MFP subunit
VIVAVYAFLRQGGATRIQTVTVTVEGGGGAGRGSPSVTANGYVVARTRAAVSAKVAGRLATLEVSEGSYVRKGAVIGTLESADYRAAVEQAEANLGTAEADRTAAEVDAEQLAREARRARELRTQNPNLISPQDVEATESRAAQADARLRAAQARVLSARAGVSFSHASLENTVIRAPFAGTVVRKEAEVGEVVAPSVGGSLTRGAVVILADLQTLEVEVDVNEAYIARIRHGQAARITLDAYPDTTFRGSVRQVVPTADRQRATVQVKVSILDRDPRILPEMGARVDFLEPDTARTAGTEATVLIRLPAAVVRQYEGQTVVWLVREGRLEPRPVEAGPVSGGFRTIRSGLAGGELLLSSGIEDPRPGMQVEIATGG